MKPKKLIVFDMDGVLIDVSSSYRDTVRQTAGLFFSPAKQADLLPEPLFDLADLAAYYAQQPRQPALHATDGIPVLVNKGDPSRMIRACNSCHGQNGEGGEYDMPYIAGQRRGYFVLAMEEFQEEDRANDIYWRMRDIARELTEEEIEELADYYASADPEEEE